MNNIKAIFKNPMSLFGIITTILTLILISSTHMHIPDFYANKDLADKIAQEVSHNMIYSATKYLITPHYYLINTLFHVWAWMTAFVIFCLIFQVNSFSKLRELKILNKKFFAYFWINISYPIFALCYIVIFMLDLNEYVYHHSSDSMGIPFLCICIFFIMLAIIYYPLANFLVFMTYNTRVRSIFYNLIWIMAILTIMLTACICLAEHFNFLCCILYLCMLISLIFNLYAIGFKKNKYKS